MFSPCCCWFSLGFSHNPKTYRTGELETVSEWEYECVCLSSLWWTGHLARVLSCLWPRKGSSLPMALHRTSPLQNIWNRWMYSTVKVLVLPLSATRFFSTNVPYFIHVSKQNDSKAIHPIWLQDPWLGFQLKLQLVVFEIITIQFNSKYSAKILYFKISCRNGQIVLIWMCFYQFWKQCVSIWKMCSKYIVFCRLLSMNDKRVCGFWKMWSLNVFCLKAMKNDS